MFEISAGNNKNLNQAHSEYKHLLTFAFVLCCHSNKTYAPIANTPNTAQLRGTL